MTHTHAVAHQQVQPLRLVIKMHSKSINIRDPAIPSPYPFHAFHPFRLALCRLKIVLNALEEYRRHIRH